MLRSITDNQVHLQTFAQIWSLIGIDNHRAVDENSNQTTYSDTRSGLTCQ